jgi:[protein-PII] uridylyltransferase
MRAIADATEADLPLVLVRRRTRRGGSEVFVYTRDQDHVFAATTKALDQLGLTIMDARIITAPNGYTLDTYIVLEAATNEVIANKARTDEIVTTVRERLLAPGAISLKDTRRAPRQLKQFSIPTQVNFSDDLANQPIREPVKFECLKRSITEALAPAP